MYMTFQYLTVSCISAKGHVYDISIPDSFVYTCFRSCIYDISTPDSFMYTDYRSCIRRFQYLTVLCIPTIGHVYDISIPVSSVYMRVSYAKGKSIRLSISPTSSPRFPMIAHLEVWSGKAHYYLHGIGIDRRVSYAKGKSIRLSISPTPSPRFPTVPTL